MATVTIEDPDEYRKDVPVDGRGRVSVGKYLAGENVTVVVKVNEDEETEDSE